ncbi:hypothetical protein GJ496_011962 [Pomphorhynchus laevis]|nr:hypothetical protein GJ496_011962 [Pomphorhynchus laevis]
MNSIAKCLLDLKIERVFGVPGYPVLSLIDFLQSHGVQYISMRNEQSASYAAAAHSYLSPPGICLSSAGPGFVNCLSGVAFAKENKWPLILIAGTTNRLYHKNHFRPCKNHHISTGRFLQLDQLEIIKPFVKRSYSSNILSLSDSLNDAVINCLKPPIGPCYIDLNFNENESFIPENTTSNMCVKHTTFETELNNIDEVVDALKNSKRPLLVVGKGCRFSAGYDFWIRKFIDTMQIPFLPMPMARGTVKDSHKLCVRSSRSYALKKSDLILIFGSRLNWQLEIKNKDCTIVQIDIDAIELSRSALLSNSKILRVESDVSTFCEHILKQYSTIDTLRQSWIQQLHEVGFKNVKVLKSMIYQESPVGSTMTHIQALSIISELLPKDCIIVNEGGNTMDYGRIVFIHSNPMTRLDAGTFGSMGVGVPFAIAASLINRKVRVVCISGDSAFGFTAMDIDTAARYRLPVLFIVFNNGYIYRSRGQEYKLTDFSDPLQLDHNTKYEHIAHAFNCPGVRVNSASELKDAMINFMRIENKPSLINVQIDSNSGKSMIDH